MIRNHYPIRNFTFTVLIALSLTIPRILCAQESYRDVQNQYSRVRQARENCERQLDSLFKSINISYPPREIVLVALKDEQLLELWAKQDSLETYTLVKTYKFTASSGTVGPKRKRGDLQIPEGFYHIIHFNPVSNFHLSLQINYPNTSDRILGGESDLGGDIFIHGSMVTIGCIPIGNASIEELYILCVDVKSHNNKNIPVYIFPSRMDSNGMAKLEQIAQHDTILVSFWKNIKQGYDIFYFLHEKLNFQIDDNGTYLFLNNTNRYSWRAYCDEKNAIINRIKTPEGYERIPAQTGSFADWLRNLPLKSGHPPVYLYTGNRKSYQGGHHAVVDIDIGTKDLQQCADAIIRLYAEYFYSRNEFDSIEFKVTSGDIIKFRNWAYGLRPSVNNNRVTWAQTAHPDSSYSNLREYLDFVFTYAGTYSLSKQLRSVSDYNNMEIGNIFIQGGFPGHAVIILDMAMNSQTGEKIFLIGQSYMPAQDFHILKNLHDPVFSPWYRANSDDTLYTPQWNFTPLESCLRAF
jgi:murein L,D-transpeptidase YafK